MIDRAVAVAVVCVHGAFGAHAQLIIDGKPTEAVEILRPALRGPIQSNNLYVTHTEIHEMLAQAFERAGKPDSAAAHYRRVALAWQNSDQRFRERASAALRKSTIR